MDCPVCGLEAEDITVKTFDGITIRCKSCGDYDISGSVHNAGMLKNLEPEERLNALKRAKTFAEPNRRPMITTYTL